jgi:hypothetical protein
MVALNKVYIEALVLQNIIHKSFKLSNIDELKILTNINGQ